jgi:hypothetical protein
MLVSCGHRSGRMLLAFLEPAGKAAGGHHRLDGQRPGGADHPQAVRHVRLVATLDGHDLGVNRGRVHGASVDQADGALVEAGLDHPGEEPGSGAHANQAVQGDGVLHREGGQLQLGAVGHESRGPGQPAPLVQLASMPSNGGDPAAVPSAS